MLLRISILLVVMSAIWLRDGYAHGVPEDHFHLFIEPIFGSPAYMTARDTASENAASESDAYKLLQHDVVRVNWPIVNKVVMESTHANGPFIIDLFGQHQCTIPFLERRSRDTTNSSDKPTQRFEGKCEEFFGNARAQFKYDPSKPWIGFTIAFPRGRMILAVLVDEDHVLVKEVLTTFRHDDSEMEQRSDASSREHK